MDIYVVYSLDKKYKDVAIYPDDPRVIEMVAGSYNAAERTAAYLRGKDPSRLYGFENWEVFNTAEEYFDFVEKWEEEDENA